jgi:hypothetical protein
MECTLLLAAVDIAVLALITVVVEALGLAPTACSSRSGGLLEGMDPRAIQWVLDHEMTHVANCDMVTFALLQAVVKVFVIFLARAACRVTDSTLGSCRNGQRPGGGAFSFITPSSCRSSRCAGGPDSHGLVPPQGVSGARGRSGHWAREA